MSYVPNTGVSTNQWNPDIDYWPRSGSNISSGSVVYTSTNTGANHWQVEEFGVTSGIYPQGQIEGFQFYNANNSTRNHTLHVKRYGYLLTKGSSTWFVDAGGVLDQPSNYSRTVTHTFTSDTLSKLRSGWSFAQFRVQISTKTGGTGTNSSTLTISDFKFKFKHDSGTGVLIVPANRSYSDRGDNRSIHLA